MKTRRRRCAPAALALVVAALLPAGSASGQGLLYDQYDNGITDNNRVSNYVVSSAYCHEDIYCADYAGADDFVIPERHAWRIERIDVDGYFAEADTPARPFLFVSIHEDSRRGGPGAAWDERVIHSSEYTVSGDGDLSIPIVPIVVPAGRWWVSIQAEVPQERLCDADGCYYESQADAWYWRPRSVVSDLPAEYRDPFCDVWCSWVDSSSNAEDLVFRLYGYHPPPIGESTEPRVAVAPDGRSVFAWLRWDGENWIAQARARAANGSLSTVQDLSVPGRDAASPQVAIDDQGDAVFTWVRSNGANQIAQARARSAAGALSAVQNLSALGQNAAAPRVDVDNDGDAVIGWMRRDGSNWIAQARARSAAGALSGVHTLSAPGADASNVELGVDADGDAVLVWQRAGAIQTRRRTRTGTVSATQTLSPSGSSSPQIGVDDAGNATYSWGAGPAELFTRRRTAAGTLSAAQLVTPPGGDVLNTRLDVNGAGHAVFVWESATYNGDEVFIAVKARHRAIDGTLASINTLANTGTGPQVALDAGGDAVFTWLGGGVVRARRRALNGTLSATQALISGGAFPRLDVDDVGNALFAWQRGNGSWNYIEARRRAEAGTLSPIVPLSDSALD